MKASELRIGNLVYDYGMIVKVDVLLLSKIYGIGELDPINATNGKYYNTKPISLTEEWLVKFGFEKIQDKNENYYSIQVANNISLTFDLAPNVRPDWCGLALQWRGIGTQIWGSVQHVHQLQNLYFALTGEELTIK